MLPDYRMKKKIAPSAPKPAPAFSVPLDKKVAAFKAGTADPAWWMDTGVLHVVSDAGVGEDGRSKRNDDESGSMLMPFYPTDSQQFLLDSIARTRAAGIPFRAIIGKDRRRRVTTLFALYFYVASVTRSDQNNIMAAHLKETAEILFNMVKVAHENNVFFRDDIALPMDRTMGMGFDGEVGPCIVKNSFFRAITSGLRSLAAARGTYITKILKTECPEFDDLNAFNEAALAALVRGKNAMDVEESTFMGYDNPFAQTFVDNWKAQGCKNWNEDGYIAGKSSTEAIFFPFYTNEQNVHPFQGDLTVGDLMGQLDDEEKAIDSLARPFFLKLFAKKGLKGDARAYARLRSAETLLFRRSRLKAVFYKDFDIPFNLYKSYSSKEEFWRQYPTDPFQAIESTGKRPFYGPTLIEFASQTAIAPSEAVFCGFIHNDSGRGFRLQPDPAGNFIVYKWPDECEGTVDLCIDPHMGLNNTRLSADDCDMTWMSSWEWRTGEQVCELFTFEDPDLRNETVWAVCKFLSSKKDVSGKRCAYSARMPYVVEENGSGCAATRYLQRNCNYPYGKIYREVTQEKGQYVRRGDVVGWTAAGRKALAVNWSKGFMMNSWCEMNGQQVGEESVIRRRIVRSKRLAEQLSWFIEDGKEYSAEQKGKGGPRSLDDAVTTLYISAYAQEKMIQERGGKFITLETDGEGTVDEKILDGAVLSMEQSVEHTRRMLFASEKKSMPCDGCGEERVFGRIESSGVTRWQCLTCGRFPENTVNGIRVYASMADMRRSEE